MTTTPANPTLNDLRDALATASVIAVDALNDIEALARTALTAMRAPDGHDTHTLARMLRCIAYRAADAGNTVVWEAETVGVLADREADAAHHQARRAYEHQRAAIGQKSAQIMASMA